MATIKDIAKLAGVAQGTVSNVLNGKGNVSSEKIRRVMNAVHQLGYVHNERAALLRKGFNDSLAVIMPDSAAKQYQELSAHVPNFLRRREARNPSSRPAAVRRRSGLHGLSL